MKNRKLLVLDIDGTLTNTQKDITPKTLEAILNIERMGHAVALASGRPTGGMRRYVDELELAKYGNYAISYNGACVTNMQTNEMVYKNALPDYVAPWMLDYAREHGLGMCIYDGNTVVCGTDVDRYIERETVLNGFNRVSVENFDAYRGMDMFKALLTAPPVRAAEHEKRLARRFIGRLSIYRSEPYFIEVMPRGVDKGAAIAGLIERLGMEREDVIACGDGLNDLAMIRYAGLGVAMGNAQSGNQGGRRRGDRDERRGRHRQRDRTIHPERLSVRRLSSSVSPCTAPSEATAPHRPTTGTSSSTASTPSRLAASEIFSDAPCKPSAFIIPPQTCAAAMTGMRPHEPRSSGRSAVWRKKTFAISGAVSHTPTAAAAPTPSAARSMPEESAQSGRPSVCRRVSSGAAAMLRLHVTNEGINKMGLSMP